MNNFRQQHSKLFGNRGPDLPNPWMSEEELVNMRRQNLQYHSVMQNMPPTMHSPLLPQNNMLPPSNKNFLNQNSCKMSGPNFSHSPNPDIFRPPHPMNDPNFSNRFIADRFSNKPYSHMNMQHKMNDGPLLKDFPAPNMPPQLHKSNRFPDSSPKLFPNMRQPQERFSCMQKDQVQFHQKYDNSPIFPGKDFPFSNKELQPQNTMAFNDKVPVSVGSNFSSQPYKPTQSLFPAYTPKDNSDVPFPRSQSMPEETAKSMHQPVYNSDFVKAPNAYCDKTPLSYSKTVESLHEKVESCEERNAPVNEVFPQHNNSPSYLYDKSIKTMSNSPVPQDSFKALENAVTSTNSKFPFSTGNQEACFQTSGENSLQRSQTMQMPNHTSTTVSRDCLMQNVPFSTDSGTSFCRMSTGTNISSQSNVHQSSKETFSSFNTSLQSDVHQRSKETFSSFSTMSQPNVHQSSKDTFSSYNTPSQSVYPSSKETFSSFNTQSQSNVHSSSKETLSPFNTQSHSNVQQTAKETLSSFNTQSHSNVQQTAKDTFSSFNFESSINSDIADLLPGLDAFLKETLNKSDELSKPEEALNKPEADVPKSDLCKSSVPSCAFSDDEWSKHSIPLIGGDNPVSSNNSIQNDGKESYCDQTTVKGLFHKFDSESEKPAELKLSDINQSNSKVSTSHQKDATIESDTPKVRSALEEAIDTIVQCDAIVGLDYIIEYKKNISQQGSFPFKCKLCNSAITRPSIIDHIIGSKHRMRYVKTKNESKYEYLVSLKLEKTEKDAKIAKVAFEMEMMYGRGHVTVNTEEDQKDTGADSKCKDDNVGIEEPVFTLDKIPIGFEALSPQHEEMDSSAFPLESDLNPIKQDTGPVVQKEAVNVPTSAEVKKEVSDDLNTDSLVLPGLGSGSPPPFARSDSNSSLQFGKFVVDIPKSCNSTEESDIKLFQNSSGSWQVKRSLSPESSCHGKILKTEASDESKPNSNMLMNQQSSDVKTSEHSAQETKEFSLDILEALSKSAITSEDEAAVVLKIISMLMQMFLRYKLQHLSLEKMENLMKSLQIRSPENIEELRSLLNENKILKETNEQGFQETSTSLQDSSKEKHEEKVLSHTDSNLKSSVTTGEASGSLDNVSTPYVSNPVSSTNVSQTVADAQMNSATSTSQTSGSFTVSAAESSKTVHASNISLAASTMNTQAANASGLKPPPFFGWQQTSEAQTNQVSYAAVQGNQNMMWSNAYQYSQPQYPQMPYYQPQNYGNTYGGTQSYASQYPIMPMNSVPIPQPLVPPPPPPPPANPPLPPSVPLPANPPPCMPLYSNQPPPPPLP